MEISSKHGNWNIIYDLDDILNSTLALKIMKKSEAFNGILNLIYYIVPVKRNWFFFQIKPNISILKFKGASNLVVYSKLHS